MTQRIVFIGAGFAGTWGAVSARRLISLNNNSAIEVVVIAPEENLAVRPRLYEANPADMNAPLGDLFCTTGVQFIKGTVDTISTNKKEVEMLNPQGVRSTLSYDRLVLAAGSRVVHPNIPGLDKFAFSVDQLDEATKLDKHLHDLSSKLASPARNTVVICGGGFTGIEVATNLPPRLRAILKDKGARIVMIDSKTEVGSTLGPGPRPVITKALEDLGIELRLGTRVTSIDANGVVTSTGERIETLTAIWTAGVAATPLTRQVDGEKDELGRLHVDQNLRVPSAKEVFAAGDAAYAVTDNEGNHTLMSCQHAIVLGRMAGNNAAADLLNIELTPYSQPFYTTCLDLGSKGAVLTNGWDRQIALKGMLAKAIKQYINTVAIYPPNANQESAFAVTGPASAIPVMPFSEVVRLLGTLGSHMVASAS
jgi:NADH dehydrogenase